MAWSTKTQIITSGSVAATEIFSTAVTLNPGELAQVEIEADFPTTPADDLIVNLYSTLDDTSENWDDTPIYSKTIDHETDPNKITISVTGLYKFRLGCERDGTTDTITVNAYYRKDGVNL